MTKQQEQATLIDELGDLELRLEPLSGDIRRREQLRTLVRSFAANAPAEKPLSLSGTRFQVTLGARQFQTELAPMRALYKAMGRELFLKVCSVTLKALKEAVHPEIVASLTTQTRTGSRSIEVHARTELSTAA
jgi:hypothetical protein